MHQSDVPTILRRLHRMWHAVDVGCEVARREGRPLVVGALIDTVWEALALAFELTRTVAYDELWDDLDALVQQWLSLESAALRVHSLDPGTVVVGDLAAATRRCLQDIRDLAIDIDCSQATLSVDPRDRDALTALGEALDVLEGTADRYFIDALPHAEHGQLDAAMALLTVCAARAGHERSTAAMRQA